MVAELADVVSQTRAQEGEKCNRVPWVGSARLCPDRLAPDARGYTDVIGECPQRRVRSNLEHYLTMHHLNVPTVGERSSLLGIAQCYQMCDLRHTCMRDTYQRGGRRGVRTRRKPCLGRKVSRMVQMLRPQARA